MKPLRWCTCTTESPSTRSVQGEDTADAPPPLSEREEELEAADRAPYTVKDIRATSNASFYGGFASGKKRCVGPSRLLLFKCIFVLMTLSNACAYVPATI